MATRQEVYESIDSERDYQDMRWREGGAEGGGANDHEADAFVTYIDYYLQEAKKIASTTPSVARGQLLQDALRKVAALCVGCMEEHGAPKRGDVFTTVHSKP